MNFELFARIFISPILGRLAIKNRFKDTENIEQFSDMAVILMLATISATINPLVLQDLEIMTAIPNRGMATDSLVIPILCFISYGISKVGHLDIKATKQ